ncbi:MULTISPECIES: hypothetical protein [Leptolyngbya]|uniref:hypothetical protein n=1 Tax=Leptolyngbya TaxID=47251 RepID=UPI00168457A0|nr:hypothetical protein [Leptolyngbya sp. FACHB-1624]MBD1858660.1 hypothetical protein [Leptolyngbya sp. FACHB-1624]
MSQKKNIVQLSSTAIARLQKLVDSGEYCSIDDAANYVVMSVLSSSGSLLAESGLKNESTQQYSAVPTQNSPEIEPSESGTTKPPPFTGL